MRIHSLFALVLVAAGCTATEQSQSLNYKSASADYSKPGAPVELKYAFVKSPTAGTPSTVALQFNSRAPIESMNANVTVSEGVQLQKTLRVAAQQKKPAATVEDQVEIVTTGDGTYYINVFVETVVNGNKLGRAFAIPVVVGDAAANQKGKQPVKTDANGNRIIELPAEQH